VSKLIPFPNPSPDHCESAQARTVRTRNTDKSAKLDADSISGIRAEVPRSSNWNTWHLAKLISRAEFKLSTWRDQARLSARWKRIAGCAASSSQQPGIWRNTEEGLVGSQGVHWCGSPFCPICGPAQSAKRADEYGAACAEFVHQGGTLYLLTLNCSHSARSTSSPDKLSDYYAGISSAWSWMNSELRPRDNGRGKSWWRGVHWIRALEEVVKPKKRGGDWHVHLHVAILVPPDVEWNTGNVRATFVDLWHKAIARKMPWSYTSKRRKNSGNTSSMVLDRWRGSARAVGGGVGSYIWGLASEVLGVAPGRQRARSKRGKDGRLTPFEALSGSREDLWRTWVQATLKRRRVQTSRGFGPETLRGELAAAWYEREGREEDPERTPVVELSREAYSWLTSPQFGWGLDADTPGAVRRIHYPGLLAAAKSGPMHAANWWRDNAPRHLACVFVLDPGRSKLTVDEWLASASPFPAQLMDERLTRMVVDYQPLPTWCAESYDNLRPFVQAHLAERQSRYGTSRLAT